MYETYAAQSVILDNGKSILQSELFYTKTGINSYSEAYGNLQDTLEYTMYNKDGQIKEISSIYISSDVSETKLPGKIKSSDSFTGTLDALNITEMVKNRDDERCFKIQNDDKSEFPFHFFHIMQYRLILIFLKLLPPSILVMKLKKMTIPAKHINIMKVQI